MSSIHEAHKIAYIDGRYGLVDMLGVKFSPGRLTFKEGSGEVIFSVPARFVNEADEQGPYIKAYSQIRTYTIRLLE